jgi:hypothetical protein
MEDIFKVWGIWVDSMGGSHWMDTAYISKSEACKIAKDLNKKADCPMHGKWVDYIVKEIEVIRLNPYKVEFKGKVLGLNTTDEKTSIKEQALTKLTKEEKEVLGLL